MTKEEFTIKELVKMRDEIDSRIQNYKDGYFYLCNVRSYGRNWTESYIHNTYTLQGLCYRYDGDDGIVDVYSNNPNLGEIYNYGLVMYVPTREDYEASKNYDFLVRTIPEAEERLAEWENRENVPFKYRPMFDPFYTQEDIDRLKLDLENFDMSFVAPVPVKYTEPVYDDEE